MQPAEAAVAVQPLVEAEMMGIPTHGLVRVPIYAERMQLGGIDPVAVPLLSKAAAALALIDGQNATGTLTAMRALDAAMELARQSGIAYVGCRHSNHCGALMPYGLKACDSGFIMIAGTSASPSMPPWGGSAVRIGNNPIAVAAPIGQGPHFLLDMAMSVAARGKIRAARDAGQPIPSGWAVDRSGQPTTDPVEALAGFLAPMGAHKGTGLSQAVDVLSGVLTGAQFLSQIPSWMSHPEEPSGLGHFFILLDPAKLTDSDTLQSEMETFRDIILDTPPANQAHPVRLPGQIEQSNRDRAIESGIGVPADLLKKIVALASSPPSV